MNTRNGYCQMKKTVPRPNVDCAKELDVDFSYCWLNLEVKL